MSIIRIMHTVVCDVCKKETITYDINISDVVEFLDLKGWKVKAGKHPPRHACKTCISTLPDAVKLILGD